MSFNGLTDAEIERLVLLAEECAEVQQAVAKILRHGYQSHDPTKRGDKQISNRSALQNELGDVSFAIELMLGNDDLIESCIISAWNEKRRKVFKYLHHNTSKEYDGLFYDNEKPRIKQSKLTQ